MPVPFSTVRSRELPIFRYVKYYRYLFTFNTIANIFKSGKVTKPRLEDKAIGMYTATLRTQAISSKHEGFQGTVFE